MKFKKAIDEVALPRHFAVYLKEKVTKHCLSTFLRKYKCEHFQPKSLLQYCNAKSLNFITVEIGTFAQRGEQCSYQLFPQYLAPLVSKSNK